MSADCNQPPGSRVFTCLLKRNVFNVWIDLCATDSMSVNTPFLRACKIPSHFVKHVGLPSKRHPDYKIVYSLLKLLVVNVARN